ncbi:hypothetical protein M011DRAFT_387942, partial [Sporormia fimetaria CBS 119925]
RRRIRLRAIAQKTLDIVPTIFEHIPPAIETRTTTHHLKDLAPLNPANCPGFTIRSLGPHHGRKGTRIRVLDKDAFDAAITLQPNTTVSSILSASPRPQPGEDTQMTDCSSTPTQPTKPVALLNLANAHQPGGGWLNGALAQEEALCYRSSLGLSLLKTLYPIPPLSALYTPHVVIIRDALPAHTLLFPNTPALDLPVTSVITAAAIFRPWLRNPDRDTYAREEDVEITMYKIRLILRVAVLQGHTKIVLGALGCGAFGNPAAEVAKLFLEVLQEEEFQGGWWEEVVFAVMDNKSGENGGKDGDGNYGVFYRALHGHVV